jgi:predicted nucleic acid-binding protein
VRAVLFDAGPLVALVDKSDGRHHEVVEAQATIEDRRVWPVVVEAMQPLSFSWRAQKTLWEMFETKAVELLPLDETDVPEIKSLMEKYRDFPMDIADAALVRVADREGIRRVLTDRRDFSVYRLARKGRFTLLP